MEEVHVKRDWSVVGRKTSSLFDMDKPEKIQLNNASLQLQNLKKHVKKHETYYMKIRYSSCS